MTTAIPAGSWEFKVALGGSWLENYGLDGEPDGDNIPFQVNQNGDEVHFYYDARDHTVLSRPDNRIIVLAGDMMAEVGGSNWSPDNLLGWMKDPDGDQVYELSLQIPAGNWQYKIAVNESWTESYGLNGVPGGSNIPLSVPAGGGLVVFRYNDLTHQITAEVGAPVMEGALITSQIAANANSYAWNTQGVASGEYRVGIRLDDHLKSNGHIVAWAPGKVTLNDTTPPPVPNYVGSFAAINGMVVRWDRDDLTPDLAGYLIEYTIPEWDLATKFPRFQRVLPRSKEKAPFFQQARLGGLIYNVSTQVCIRAYDASGNLSGCASIEIEMPEGPVERIGPPRFFNGGGNLNGLSLTWEPPEFGTPDGYLLYYEPAGCLLPDVVSIANEGKSPIILPLGDLNFSLSGLTIGQHYRFTLHAYTDQGDISPGVSIVRMVIDPTDNDDDLIPDQWEVLFGISNPLDDTDLDGLNDLAEYQQGSNPLHADSDLDEFYDGEEAEWGVNVCGVEQPPYHKEPKLVVVNTNTVNFTAAVNFNPGNSEFIQILNFGGGNLIWNATPSQRWIMLSSFSGGENENLAISVDITGLVPGVYSGEILVFTLPAVQSPTLETASIQESVSIPVTLVILPEKQFDLYLPLMER